MSARTLNIAIASLLLISGPFMAARTVAAAEGRQTLFFTQTQSVSAPVNDNFNSAIAFALPQAGALPGTNVSATTEPGEPNHASIPAHGSICGRRPHPQAAL